MTENKSVPAPEEKKDDEIPDPDKIVENDKAARAHIKDVTAAQKEKEKNKSVPKSEDPEKAEAPEIWQKEQFE